MKFSCTKEQLVHAVNIVQKAVSNKPQMPILSGIYLNAENNMIELQATDYELGIICKIEANVEKAGAIVLSGRYFQDVVKKLPGETVEIVTNKEEHTMKITQGMFYAAFPWDGHQPVAHTREMQSFTKIVLKLPASWDSENSSR